MKSCIFITESSMCGNMAHWCIVGKVPQNALLLWGHHGSPDVSSGPTCLFFNSPSMYLLSHLPPTRKMLNCPNKRTSQCCSPALKRIFWNLESWSWTPDRPTFASLYCELQIPGINSLARLVLSVSFTFDCNLKWTRKSQTNPFYTLMKRRENEWSWSKSKAAKSSRDQSGGWVFTSSWNLHSLIQALIW